MFGGQRAKTSPQGLGRRDSEVLQPVGGLGACLDRPPPGYTKRPERLCAAVAGLGGTGCFAVESGSSGRLGVSGIGRAPPASDLGIRSDDLYDGHILGGEIAGQSGTVTAGALHTDLD